MKNRILYLVIFIFLTGLALATRKFPTIFHPFIVKYGGDTIWAGMFLFLVRAIFTKTELLKLAIICYALGVIDELLQLFHAPWIESIRSTYLGRLMLGVGFVWTDLWCYLIGIVMSYFLIFFYEKKFAK